MSSPHDPSTATLTRPKLPEPLPPTEPLSRQVKLWSTLAELCELLRLPDGCEQAFDDEPSFQHLHFQVGQRVHTSGQPFEALYVVHNGFLKTVSIDEAGNEQVLSFPMRGDLFGVDGIHHRRHPTEAVALSCCDVIVVPFSRLLGLARRDTHLEDLIYRIISRELIRQQTQTCMLGALSAEARVARFLVTLSERFEAMGYSGKLFNLRMTRHEIGSYLGLTLETISRALSAFNESGLIKVAQRSIEINDIAALKTLRRVPPSYGRGQRSRGAAARTQQEQPITARNDA